ncbi:hypothetical protein MTR67_052052 [Solanum verrucosum]|uniref:Uncharacterized protein n=1 Tax=Solanum verrucosum TaxID=315347 RepID=A0AAF0ZZM0_SOLVR|nr:hypothetical protein MTR67_052052 [Solanum verrucosum]
MCATRTRLLALGGASPRCRHAPSKHNYKLPWQLAGPRLGSSLRTLRVAPGESYLLSCELEWVDDTTIPATTAEARAPPSTFTSHVGSSSRATASSGSVLTTVARVQKLETQMVILLQHMRPWMQRVLERARPTNGLTTFKVELAKLRSDVNGLLASVEVAPEHIPKEKIDDVVLSTLFGNAMLVPEHSRAAGKGYLSLGTLMILMRLDGSGRESSSSFR